MKRNTLKFSTQQAAQAYAMGFEDGAMVSQAWGGGANGEWHVYVRQAGRLWVVNDDGTMTTHTDAA